MIKILFVDDEPAYGTSFIRAMRKQKDFCIVTASDGSEALQRLETFHADIVITDVMMANMDGLALLKEIKEKNPHIFVLVMTGHSSISQAVKAMKLGAYDYLLKPLDFDMIKMILKKIINHKKIFHENILPEKRSRSEYRFENIIGQDQKMFKIYETIAMVAKTDASVIITGESGTGKELVALATHFRSLRREKPFVRVNCAAFTETLINSELFGHEKGAFTGANVLKKGHFELADKGTIFLDEIGDISLQTQVSLLRVLELGTFQRVGSTKTIKIDTRLICATNQDLSRSIQQKNFREDLFYRINVVSVNVPPLRERKSDIPLLADYFLKKNCNETKRKITHLSGAAMKRLLKYDWPGNVRELANVIERAVILSKGSVIMPEDLPETMKISPSIDEFKIALSSRSLPLAEAILIRKVLEEYNWNIKQAAGELEVARGTLYSKIKKYRIEKH